jgi:hypothetical protein
VDEHRYTLSAAYAHNFANGDNFSATSYLGQNIVPGKPRSNGFLAEGTLYHRKEALFARFERVDKDELYNIPQGIYTVNKALFGDVHTLYSRDGLDYGLGAYMGLYRFPSSLTPYYGSPLTWGVFFRVGAAR